MSDPRISKLADILVNYSVAVKKGDHVLLSLTDEGMPLLKEVYELCLKKGAITRVHIHDSELDSVYFGNASKTNLEYFHKVDMQEAKWADCSIRISGSRNTKNLSSIDSSKISTRMKTLNPIRNHIVDKVRWVICNYPSNALAQDAEMSLDEYTDFVFNATNIDWKKISKKQTKIKRILDAGSIVHIKGDNTDLTFSIKGRQGIKCDGYRNMPDGEVFVAPDEFSAEGYITYDFPAIYRGKEVEGIRLEFKKGLCVKATAKKNEKYLNTLLNTDKGARRLGEFGIGMNYGIQNFSKSILFDEKIGGTIHLATGMAYNEGGGKNKSAIHWDMIKDLRKNGEITIDGKLFSKNGKFVF